MPWFQSLTYTQGVDGVSGHSKLVNMHVLADHKVSSLQSLERDVCTEFIYSVREFLNTQTFKNVCGKSGAWNLYSLAYEKCVLTFSHTSSSLSPSNYELLISTIKSQLDCYSVGVNMPTLPG